MISLSICIPSHGSLGNSITSIRSAVSLLEYGLREVIVCDNSDDPAKEVHFRALRIPGLTYIRSSSQDVFGNWLTAFQHASGDFILPLGDDDIITALPNFQIPSHAQIGDAIGFRPAFAMFTSGNEVGRYTNFSIDADTPSARVEQYLRRNGGANVMFTSAVKKDIWLDFLGAYIQHHPTKAVYTDWSIAFGIAARGNLISANDVLYLYNNENWNTNEKIQKRTAESMKKSGLPEDAEVVQFAFRAIDAFVAVCMSCSDKNIDGKIEAGRLILDTFYKSLLSSFANKLSELTKPDPLMMESAKIILSAVCPRSQFHACLELINIWAPHFSRRYSEFLRNVLDRRVINTLTHRDSVSDSQSSEPEVFAALPAA